MINRNSLLAAATALISLTAGAALAADSNVPSRGPVPFEVLTVTGISMSRSSIACTVRAYSSVRARVA